MWSHHRTTMPAVVGLRSHQEDNTMGSPTGQNYNNGSVGHHGFNKVPGDMGGASVLPGYGYDFGMPQQNPGMPQPGGPTYNMINGNPTTNHPNGFHQISGGGLQYQPQPGGPQVIGSQSHGNPGQPPQIAPGGGSYGGGGMRTYDLQPGDPGHPMTPVGWQQPQPGQYPGMLNPSGPGTNVQNPGMPPQGGGGTPIQPPPGPPQGAFQGLAKGTMGAMRGHVQAGKMGQAKKAYEAGGGTWNKDVSRRLRNKWG